MAFYGTGSKFLVAHFAAFGIVVFIQPGVDLQAGFGCGRPDGLDNDFQIFQGDAATVAGGMAEDAVFDFVPFAGAWWVVADFDDLSRLVRQRPRFEFPQSASRTVAVAAVGGDQQTFGFRVTLTAQFTPPAANCGNGELRQRRIAAAANSAVSWLIPTDTPASLA